MCDVQTWMVSSFTVFVSVHYAKGHQESQEWGHFTWLPHGFDVRRRKREEFDWCDGAKCAVGWKKTAEIVESGFGSFRVEKGSTNQSPRVPKRKRISLAT